jgi:ABC-type Fe3+/spermidine/putrescine transport system ATPase subunit
LLLVDEPIDRFDANERDAIARALRQAHQAQRLTTLAVTRHAPEALGLGDRVALLEAGRILQAGRPSEVYLRPEGRRVAQAFGPINVVEGVVETVDGKGQCVLRTPLGRLVARPGARRPEAGAVVSLLFRPESLQVGPAGFGTNRFAATLVRRVPQAMLWRLDLEGAGEWRGWALALPSQAGTLREGQSVTVSVAPESLVMDAPGGGEGGVS